MADTRRELSALQTLLSDNSSGDISAQDARDVLISESPSFLHPTSAFASPPSTPVTGDLWLPSDGFCVYRYSGSAWVPWGPNHAFTEPALAAPTTWINQGSATVQSTNGGIVLNCPANASAFGMRIRKKTAPATPYTISAAFVVATKPITAIGFFAGLCWRQSSDGKLVHSCLESASGVGYVGSYKMTSATVFSASYFEVVARGHVYSSVVWFRIEDDGTNRKQYVSADGINWVLFHSVGRTDFMTADEVGFFIDPYNAETTMTLLHWKEA